MEIDDGWQSTGERWGFEELAPPEPDAEPLRVSSSESSARSARSGRRRRRLLDPQRVLRSLSDSSTPWVLGVVTAWYAWVTASVTVRNHNGMGTFGFDFALYDQALWLMSRFHAPFVTIMGRNLFGDHASWVMLPLVPVYWVWPRGAVILIAQAVALALGAVPAYLLARDRLRSEIAGLVFAGAYLLHPALQWSNMEQFHPDVAAAPALLGAVWAMRTGRWRLMIGCCIVACSVKEDLLLVVVPLGLVCAWRYRRRLGLAIAAGSLLWSAINVLVVLRLLNGVGSLNGWRIPYGGPVGFVGEFFRNPGAVLSYLWSDGRPWYVWQMLIPVGLLALGSIEALALIALPFASNLVSNFGYQHMIQYHYSLVLVPGIIVGAIDVTARFRAKHRVWVLLGVSVSSVWSMYLWGPYAVSRRPAPVAVPSAQNVIDARAVMRDIPDDAVVSAFYGYVPQLSHRKLIYQFPTPFRAAYWGTFHQEGKQLADRVAAVQWLMIPRDLGPAEIQLRDALLVSFRLVREQGNAQLYERIRPTTPVVPAPGTAPVPAGGSTVSTVVVTIPLGGSSAATTVAATAETVPPTTVAAAVPTTTPGSASVTVATMP